MSIADQLALLPDQPGVYLFKDKHGRIIYVGKAVSLRHRVRSYFQPGAKHTVKVRALVEKVSDLETIITDNEVEALILESNLIKQHQPWYNIRIKDDKHYPYLKLTMQETFPRLLVARRIQKDGAKYFGPYPSANSMRQTLKLIRRLFPLRTCKQPLDGEKRGRPCLNLQIKRCIGPCTGTVSRDEYLEVVYAVDMFLSGRYEDLTARLQEQMEQAAANLEFERAAELRDQLNSVERIMETQKMISAGLEDRDVIALARGVEETCVSIFFVREGKTIGRDNFFLSGTEDMPSGEVLAAFIKQYYGTALSIPREILLSAEPPADDASVMVDWLSRQRGGKVSLATPKRGVKKRLVEMVEKNAAAALEERLARVLNEGQLLQSALQELATHLELTAPPRRIECYDISNISGTEAVGSMVVMLDGKPARQEYRRFKIRGIEGPNDFAMMEQVLARRFNRVRLDDEKFADLPDLIIIDGGKGQLSAARRAMERLGFGFIPTAGLAEPADQLFLPGRPEPIELPRQSQSLFLVQRIRDEAHRFALTYHRQLRSRQLTASWLESCPGIGAKRRQALLKAFGSVKRLRAAELEELAAVPGIPRTVAERLYLFLREAGEPDREG
ncbi:MAG: excinuclease ABC subunit UvrC [Bacillota bacterium]|jgi:excinuclease ABC subunit C